MPHSVAAEVLNHWFGPAANAIAASTTASIASIEPMTLGFSGAAVFRVRDSNGNSFALKRYPDATTIDRIVGIHRFMSLVYRRGCHLVPRLWPVLNSTETVVWDGTRGWELVDWVAGSPIETTTNPQALLDAVSKGAAAIATVHRAAHSFDVQWQPAASVAVRIKRIEEISILLDRLIGEGRANVMSGKGSKQLDAGLCQSLLNAIDCLAHRWRRIAIPISASLRPLATERFSNQYVIRDVHREHLFFNNEGASRVSGIIDFDAVRIDSPATDLARWTTSFLSSGIEWSRLCNATFAGYRQAWELSDREEMLARRLAPATVWISLANWAVWVALQGRSFPVEPDRIAARIEECLKSVEYLS